MKLNVVLAGLLAVPAVAVTARRNGDGKERPVAKVVRMLEDMKVELQSAKETDDEVYQQLTCWCNGGTDEKKSAIELGEAKMDDLKSAMGEYGAKVEELREGLATTKAKLRDDKAALDTAVAIRMKENKAFHEEEVDMLDAIQGCDNALKVLGKHQASLAQIKEVGKSLQALTAMQLAKDNLGRDKMAVVKAFVQEAEDSSISRLRIPGMQSYAPQSGQIVGILGQMKEDFEGDLKNSQAEEATAVSEFTSLKKAKEDELAAGKAQQDQLEQDDAEFREKNAQAYEEYLDTEEQVNTDKEFLRNLKARCEVADEEYAARTKGRLAELEAVADTIVFLNSDEAAGSFDKSVNSAFLQTSSLTVSAKQDARQHAAQVLRRTGNAQLALLASTVQLDAFEKVKVAIDNMVKELGNQQKEEVEHRDFCIAETNKNTRETAEMYDKKAILETTIADTTKTVEELTKDIAERTKAIAAMQKDMKRASEVREAENGEFQEEVMNQRITQGILQKACDRMNQVYSDMKVSLEQDGAAPHTQTSATSTDPGNGPARFDKYEQSGGGDKIVKMIEDIIADSKESENEALRSEQDAQAAYEGNMKDLNKSITEHTRAITNNTENKAKAEQTLTAAKADFKSTMKELEGLNDVLKSLVNQCDFVVKNFEARQAARSQEIDALNEAKAILSGA